MSDPVAKLMTYCGAESPDSTMGTTLLPPQTPLNTAAVRPLRCAGVRPSRSAQNLLRSAAKVSSGQPLSLSLLALGSNATSSASSSGDGTAPAPSTSSGSPSSPTISPDGIAALAVAAAAGGLTLASVMHTRPAARSTSARTVSGSDLRGSLKNSAPQRKDTAMMWICQVACASASPAWFTATMAATPAGTHARPEARPHQLNRNSTPAASVSQHVTKVQKVL
mmetsp:Transcript_23575/g.74002  ORF Transcript_23575/g.74002 Transcript_23575/m.74002 type:complete len:223 (+) Transcript_23575:1494-2162(+)